MTDDPIKNDFRNFLYLAWQYLGYKESAIQYDVAYHLQHGPDKSIIAGLRGLGKSVICAAYSDWLLYCNPDSTILSVSGASTRSREFIRFARKLLEMPICHHLRPRIDRGDRDGADRFDCGARTRVDKNPSIAAYGIGAMITGTHVDVIIPDDIETRNNSLTIDARDKLFHQCLEFESVVNPGGKIVYLGTPQNISSVYLRLAKKYSFVKWPARYLSPSHPSYEQMSETLKKDLETGKAQVGDSTFPEKFDDATLLEKEAVMGPTEWELQMLLNTTLADSLKYPLKASDFIVYDTTIGMAPKKISWGTSNRLQIECSGLDGDGFYGPIYVDPAFGDTVGTTMYVDPAGKGGDETGIAVGNTINGYVYVHLATGFPGGHDEESLLRILETAEEYGVKQIVVEPNYGDGMYTKAMISVAKREGYSIAIVDGERVLGKKEQRIIDSVEVPLANHRIIINKSVAADEEFIYQLTHITRDANCLRHDDRIDAFAGLIKLFRDQIQIDAKSKIENDNRKKFLEEIKLFEQSWNNGLGNKKYTRGSPDDPRVRKGSVSGSWGKQKFGW